MIYESLLFSKIAKTSVSPTHSRGLTSQDAIDSIRLLMGPSVQNGGKTGMEYLEC